MIEQRKKGFWSFLLTAYGLFWGIVAVVLTLIGTGILNVSLEGDSLFLSGIKILFSWTPTMAVLIHMKKLFPGLKRKDFVKGLFHQPVKWKLIFLIIGLQVFMNLVAGVFIAVYDQTSFVDQWSFSASVVINAALMSLLTGASGEECGWRGYLLPHFMEKKGCIQSCILVGIIWGFWHLPLWLISGYSGVELLLYCLQFMVCVIDWSVIMGILYCWNRNLFIPMFFHFMVNFSLCFFVGNDMLYQVILAVLYTLVAIIAGLLYTKYKNKKGIQ